MFASKKDAEEAPVVYIRRLRAEERDSLSEDLRFMLPGAPEHAELFCVAPNKLRSNGVLLRGGHWQDNNFVHHAGIQMLILQGGVQVDLETVCRGMLMEVDSVKERSKKLGVKRTPEELVEDAKEARRLLLQQQQRELLSTLPVMDNFVLENRVVPEDDARIIARCIQGNDSADTEGLRCTLSGLHIVNALLRDAGCTILAASLPKNKGITHIDFGHNSIGDVGSSALFQNCIGRTLNILKLGSNALTDKGCKMIPHLLETVPLQELHLHNNMIGDEGVKYIAQGLGFNHTMQVLNMNGNRIRDGGVEVLASILMLTYGEDHDPLAAMRNVSKKLGQIPTGCHRRVYASNTSLTAVHLASNWLSDHAAQEIASVFRSNYSLTNVELASNRIGDAGAKALAEALKVPYEHGEGNRIGRNLVLNCNNIGGGGMLELQRAMKMSDHLHTLSVEGMRVPFARRAGIFRDSATAAAVDLTGSRKLPRIRLEAIHHEREEVDLEARVNAEFKPKLRKKLALSANIKESFFPIDRFMDDHVGHLQHQSGWGGSTTRGPTTARTPTSRISTASRGAFTARASTQGSSESSRPAFTGYTDHLIHDSSSAHFDMDDDVEFQKLCQRLKVPVQDKLRSRLKALNEKQRTQRARVYDKFLDVQTRFHRPTTTAVVQVQSLYRGKKATKLASLIRKKNEEDGQTMANEAKADLAMDQNDGVHTVLSTLAAPGKRRLFSKWCDQVNAGEMMKKDIVETYAGYCTSMGVSACGTSLLKKFVNQPYSETLNLEGIGISALSARALSFVFMGVAPCRMCRGMGYMAADMFKAMAQDPMVETMTARNAFRAVDLDDSGFVDSSELLVAFRHLGLNLDLEEVEAVLSTIDEDQSGQIDQEEFELLFKNMTSESGPGQCVLCSGKGQCGKPCFLEQPTSRELKPLLQVREWMGHRMIHELSLSGNCLRHSGAKDVFNLALTCGSALQTLRVARNELGDDGATAIAPLFCNKSMSLTECDLSGNGIGDNGMLQISGAVRQCKSIKLLNLSSNACTGTGCRVLGEMLEENESLTELDISWNGIGGEMASLFWRGLENSTSLIKLHAAWNGFCHLTACEALSDMLEENRTLQFIDLSHNRITEACCRVIARGFAMNETLLEVKLDGNPLKINGAKILLAAAEEGAKDSDYARTVRMENCSVGVLDMSMFSPLEPAGRYILDMSNLSSRQVLRNLLLLVARGRVGFEKMMLSMEMEKRNKEGELVKDPDTGEQLMLYSQELYVLPGFMTKEQFHERGFADSDPLKWEMPDRGSIEFNVMTLRLEDDPQDKPSVSKGRSKALLDGFSTFLIACKSHRRTSEQKIADLATQFPGAQKISFDQFKALYDILVESDDGGGFQLIEKFWHKVHTDACSRAVLGLLPEDQRARLLQDVGLQDFPLMTNNPSGFYHLNLDLPQDLQLAGLLLDAKNGQSETEQQLRQYAEGRMGGARDQELLDRRAWRNCTLNGVPCPFKRAWRMPTSGILELDFVKLTKPDPDKHSAMSDGYFRALLKEISAEGMTAFTRLMSIKTTSNNQFFSIKHIAQILESFPAGAPSDLFQPRVELMVTVFGRTIDWLGLTRLYDLLLPFERKMLAYRLGEENMFAEAMAVNYYELDLSDAAQRYVLQEIVHIAYFEPGENCVQLQYQGCDYKMPASWVSNMPRYGQVSLFYARTAEVIQEVMAKGSCDWKIHPNPLHHPGFFSDYVPSWLKDLEMSNQPEGLRWMDAYKVRMIKTKIQGQAAVDPVEAFRIFDLDGSGEMDRLEIIQALIRIGLWLSQSDISLLISCLDEDGGGSICEDEFVEFWHSYSFA